MQGFTYFLSCNMGALCRCACLIATGSDPAPNDYFCDTASATQIQDIFYADDPLWDGTGLWSSEHMLHRYLSMVPQQFPQPTTDYIEMRICSNQCAGNEDIAVETIDINFMCGKYSSTSTFSFPMPPFSLLPFMDLL